MQFAAFSGLGGSHSERGLTSSVSSLELTRGYGGGNWREPSRASALVSSASCATLPSASTSLASPRRTSQPPSPRGGSARYLAGTGVGVEPGFGEGGSGGDVLLAQPSSLVHAVRAPATLDE